MTATAVLPQNIVNDAVTIVNADGTTVKDLLNPVDGTFAEYLAINVTSNDTSARVLQFYITSGGTDYLIGSVNIPTLAGTDGTTAAVNVLASSLFTGAALDQAGNKVLYVQNVGTTKFRVGCTTTVTTAKTVTVVGVRAKF